MTVELSRRGFLKGSAAGMAALVIGLDSRGVVAAGENGTVMNPFVRIDRNGFVTVIIKHFEMGQGTTTGLTTLVAEELDADWRTIKAEFAPADAEKYKNLFWGMQGTGGSSAMANSFMQYRQAGATARDLLVRAAAQSWGVPVEDIVVSNGILTSGSRRAHFGDFVSRALTLEATAEPTLKSPGQFKLIGNVSLPRKDSKDKTDGTATFAIDVKIPGMVVAVIKRSPRFGGSVENFDTSAAREVSGFIDARALPNNAGVVVYAKNTWAAFKSRDAVKVTWNDSNAETRSSEEMFDTCHAMLNTPTYQARPVTRDRALGKIGAATKTIQATFDFPYLAHAPMEPLNCVIEPTANGVRFHDGCQMPSGVQAAMGFVLELEPQQVEINTVYAGGSFGRRATPTADYHVEAAMAFALLGKQTPVKLVWSREDDIHGGYYRSMASHQAEIGLDASGNILGWDHRIVTKSIMKGTAFEAFAVHDGIDHSSVEGCADTLYQVPEMAVGLSDFETTIPVLWWRSVGHTHTAFAMESLLDMVARESGRDPVEMRLALLDKNDDKQRRMANVIETARDMSGWTKGDSRGFAAHFSFNTWVAVVASVTVEGDKVHVDKLHIAVDCGVAVNPDVIKAQMEGGAGYALGAVMRNEVTLKEGVVVQSNFPDYQPLRINDMPEIEVRIIASGEAPSGVGEPSTPPTGPAVANAIFGVSGKRVTQLPMTRSGIQFV